MLIFFFRSDLFVMSPLFNPPPVFYIYYLCTTVCFLPRCFLTDFFSTLLFLCLFASLFAYLYIVIYFINIYIYITDGLTPQGGSREGKNKIRIQNKIK